MVIPEWFVWCQGAVTTILVPICGAALNILWRMRQELTALNVKMELALVKTIVELKEEINKLRKRNHQLTNQLTVITAKLDMSKDRNRQMDDSEISSD